MEHMALYRRFRPMTFDEIVEQDHAVSALRQSARSGKIGHAYLFSGTRGTGKTSIAKIFARAINCLSPDDANPCNQCDICRGILEGSILDVIEMDAASNNSVDNIRRICDEVLFLPSQAKYKVYIVDEVHMLSTGAFNALLKTLEEPPEHAVFILATTEPHRIPATIISRCQRYDFRRIPIDSMVQRLASIAKQSHIHVDNDALIAISTLADGALRDAISLLDQVSTGAVQTITPKDVYAMVGLADRSVLFRFAHAILSADIFELLSLCDQILLDGRDIMRFTLDLAHFFRDLTVVSVSQSPELLLRSGASDINEMRRLANIAGTQALIDIISVLSELTGEMKWSPDMRTTFEIALVSLSKRFITENHKPHSSNKCDTTATPTQTIEPDESKNAPDILDMTLIQTTATDPKSVEISNVATKPTDSKKSIKDLNVQDQPAQSDTKSVSDPKKEPAEMTPNLTRTTDSKRSDSGYKTNLSTLVSGSSVRKPSIPLPPDIPDEDDFSPPPPVEPKKRENEKPQSSDEKPEQMLKRQWTDALLFLEKNSYEFVLLLRHAKISLSDKTLSIVLPKHMAEQVHQLTQADDYKRISDDITCRLDSVEDIRILIESEDSDLSQSSQPKAITLDNPAQPDWVKKMLDIANQHNIPIENSDTN